MAASTKVWVNNSPPQCAAEDLNGFELENNNLIDSTGQTLNISDNFQTSKAVAAYAANGDFYDDAGAPNAYVLVVQNNGGAGYRAPPTYCPGMRVRFIAANSNTGASTVNVATLGVKNIIERDGSPLDGGEIEATRITELQYDGTDFILMDNGSDVVSVPSGVSLDFAGTSIPDGFLLEDGTAVSRTTFARLFAAIGVLWGVGDGSTTFNLPDIRGRMILGAGQGSGLTNRVIATSGGAEDVIQSILTMAGHSHNFYVFAGGNVNSDPYPAAVDSTANPATNTTFSTGGGQPLPIMNPWVVMNKIIKT